MLVIVLIGVAWFYIDTLKTNNEYYISGADRPCQKDWAGYGRDAEK